MKFHLLQLNPLWGNSTGERSPVTGQEQIAGLYPPNRFPDEVLTNHPNRLRAVWVDSNNPINTGANTKRFEDAFRQLELAVVVDVAMTETARSAHYVLPAARQYEKWEYTFFTLEFPTNYFQLRAPIFEPLPGTLPEAEIYSPLLSEMGELPPDTELESLRQLAAADRVTYGQTVMGLMSERPGLAALAPVLLYKTLGAALPNGAANAGPLWFACQRLAKEDPDAVRAAGIQREDLPLARRSSKRFSLADPARRSRLTLTNRSGGSSRIATAGFISRFRACWNGWIRLMGTLKRTTRNSLSC